MTQKMPNREATTLQRVAKDIEQKAKALEDEEARLEETIADTNLTEEQRSHLTRELKHHKEKVASLSQASRNFERSSEGASQGRRGRTNS